MFLCRASSFLGLELDDCIYLPETENADEYKLSIYDTGPATKPNLVINIYEYAPKQYTSVVLTKRIPQIESELLRLDKSHCPTAGVALR